MKETLVFPKGFLWGSGTSSEQIEPNGTQQQGNKTQNVFNYDYSNRKELYFEGKFCENNFYEKYKGDLNLAKEIGFNSIRLSVSWALLQPNEGQQFDQGAVEYYRDVFKTARENNLKLTVTLIHFDLPMWIADKGGWANRETVDHFEQFAKGCFSEFDSLVDYWAVFNESFANTTATYLFDKQPQFKGTDDRSNFPKAIWNIAVATAKAVKAHKEVGAKATIGSIFVASNIYSKTDSEEDLKAARIAELFAFRIYSDANILGVFPEEAFEIWLNDDWIESDFREPEDIETIKNNVIEWIGINYYLPIRVHAPSEGAKSKNPLLSHFNNYFVQYNDDKYRFNHDRGWEIYPKGLYDRFKEVKSYYGDIPMMVTEVGIGVQNEDRFRNEEGIIQDKYRIQFHSEHIYWTHKALEEGCNILGYQMWTYIDNWSFTNAYKNRYGFIELDLNTGERVKKLSSNWMKTIGETNTLSFDINISPEDDEITKL